MTRREELEAEVRRRVSEALSGFVDKPYTPGTKVEILRAIRAAMEEHAVEITMEITTAQKFWCFRHKADPQRFVVVSEGRLREMEASGEIDEYER